MLISSFIFVKNFIIKLAQILFTIRLEIGEGGAHSSQIYLALTCKIFYNGNYEIDC